MSFNLTTDGLAKSFGVSRKTILRWVENEILKYGKHYVNLSSPNSYRATLRFNLEACQKVFLVPPEKR